MTRNRRLALTLSLVAFATPAVAMGPVVTVGGVVTLKESATSANGEVTFNHLTGPATRVGFEIGDRFNHELSFQFSLARGAGRTGGLTVPIEIMTLAGSYTFSIDFFTKQGLDALPGFTPSLGIGLAVGQARLNAGGQQATAPYLELHAGVGFKYTWKSGLGLRAEVVASTYGGFLAVQPSVGVSYRF